MDLVTAVLWAIALFDVPLIVILEQQRLRGQSERARTFLGGQLDDGHDPVERHSGQELRDEDETIAMKQVEFIS